jgi:hypothetical protein
MSNDYVNHKWPRLDDRVYDPERDRQGLNSHGQVFTIDRGDKEVLVKFFGEGYQVCSQLKNTNFCRDCIHTNPEWYSGGGDVETYSFDYFHNWSSHEGGEGWWELGTY